MGGPKYHPYTSCGSQDFCCPSFLCMTNLVPGGERVVLLRSKSPSNTIYTEIYGFDIYGLDRFNVIWDCFRRRHHRCIGYIFPTPHSPAMKWFLHVYMACSDAFLLCMQVVTNRNATDCCLSKVLNAYQASFFRKCVDVSNPIFASSS